MFGFGVLLDRILWDRDIDGRVKCFSFFLNLRGGPYFTNLVKAFEQNHNEKGLTMARLTVLAFKSFA